jgi:hypothetical protein
MERSAASLQASKTPDSDHWACDLFRHFGAPNPAGWSAALEVCKQVRLLIQITGPARSQCLTSYERQVYASAKANPAEWSAALQAHEAYEQDASSRWLKPNPAGWSAALQAYQQVRRLCPPQRVPTRPMSSGGWRPNCFRLAVNGYFARLASAGDKYTKHGLKHTAAHWQVKVPASPTTPYTYISLLPSPRPSSPRLLSSNHIFFM